MDGGQVAGHSVLGQNPDLKSSLNPLFSHVQVRPARSVPLFKCNFRPFGLQKARSNR